MSGNLIFNMVVSFPNSARGNPRCPRAVTVELTQCVAMTSSERPTTVSDPPLTLKKPPNNLASSEQRATD